jgi:small subunit ribosomal protein S17
MANKKKETEVEETEATTENVEASEEVSATEEKPKKAAKAEKTEDAQPSVISSVIDTVTSAVGSVADAVVNAVGGGSSDDSSAEKTSKRAQRIGVVTSDKMTKTVTVRVDRLIKHPKYRRYVRRKKQFMAHDETGAAIGDKVRIIETRPLSARKRWRVVEIIQKAAK